LSQPGGGLRREVRRQAGVPVVEPGQLKTTIGQGRAELVRPDQHLHPGPADQQERHPIGRANGLIGEDDVSAGCCRVLADDEAIDTLTGLLSYGLAGPRR